MNATAIIHLIKELIEKNYKAIVVLFFASYLLVGVFIFKDYGISDDESPNRYNGVISAAYINNIFGFSKMILPDTFFPKMYRLCWPDKIPELRIYSDRDYGVLFELTLVMFEYIIDKWVIELNDFRTIFLMRHLLTFLMFWISVIFFYLVVEDRFQDWKTGLIGCLFLILSPRIFAESFYNSKDLIFLSFSIISTFTLIKFIQHQTFVFALIHAISSAAFINIRIPAIYIPVITILFISIECLRYKFSKSYLKKIIPVLFVYLLLFACFTCIFWPYLWENPVSNFIQAFTNMKKFRWPWDVLYWGNFIKASNLPWHYIPSWVIITTPFLYIFLFFSGLFSIVSNLLKHPSQIYENEKSDLIFISLFFCPLLAVILFKSVVFDGWRHMYFIYPSFLLVAIVGFVNLMEYIKRFSGMTYRTANTIFILCTIYSISSTAFFMIKYHPHQNVYFNFVAGKNVSEKFELDYWGLAYKQALEYILSIDNSPKISIFRPFTVSLNYNVLFLGQEAKSRIHIVDALNDADYFVTNYRATWYRMFYDKFHKKEYPFSNEIFSVKVKDYKIVGVYKPTLYAMNHTTEKNLINN